jgi:hypothetical protein
VQPDEARRRVRSDEDLELLVQSQQRRELASAVPPVGVFAQLLDPRVVVGQRSEEGRRIAAVDRDRQAALARRSPQRLEARIADGDPSSRRVAQP